MLAHAPSEASNSSCGSGPASLRTHRGKKSKAITIYSLRSDILQPQSEVNFYSQADPVRGIGSGFSDLDSGLRIGYQISRKFAPYVGHTYSGVYGETGKFSRWDGEPTSEARNRVWNLAVALMQ